MYQGNHRSLDQAPPHLPRESHSGPAEAQNTRRGIVHKSPPNTVTPRTQHQEINSREKMSAQAVTTIDIQGKLPKIASGKVRDLYAIDDDTLLFVASDRISAYDVIMENVSSTSPNLKSN